MASALAKISSAGTRMVTSSMAKGQRLLVWSQGKGQIFWKYAKVELRPPTLAEFPEVGVRARQVIKAAQTGKWKTMPVREAWMNTIVFIEVLLWFYVGECIGKGGLIGYNIKGAFHDYHHDPGYHIH